MRLLRLRAFGDPVPPHHHEGGELLVPLSGHAVVDLWSPGPRSFLLRAPIAVWFPPGCRHQLRRPELAMDLLVLEVGEPHEHVFDEPVVFDPFPSLVLDVVLEQIRQKDDRSPLGLAFQAQSLAWALTRLQLEHRCRGLDVGDLVVRRALAWMRQDPARCPPLADMARVLGVSPRTLQRRFLRQEKCNARQALARIRAEAAARLLRETDLAVSQVAFEVGFESESSLRRAFAAWAGCSPSEYRRRGLAG